MTDMEAVRQSRYWAQIPEWVLLHADLEHLDIRVFASMQRYSNHGEAVFPGQDTLAAQLRVDRKTVNRALTRLAAAGAVLVVKVPTESGRWPRNEYTLQMEPPSDRSPVSDHRVPPVSDHHVPPVVHEPEPVEPEPTTRVRDTDVPFDAFWNAYPRRDDKRAARKAWDALAKKGELPDLAVILEGALRYAGEVEGRERRFVKLPATWLNAGSWGNGHDAKAEGEWTEWG